MSCISEPSDEFQAAIRSTSRTGVLKVVLFGSTGGEGVDGVVDGFSRGHEESTVPGGVVPVRVEVVLGVYITVFPDCGSAGVSSRWRLRFDGSCHRGFGFGFCQRLGNCRARGWSRGHCDSLVVDLTHDGGTDETEEDGAQLLTRNERDSAMLPSIAEDASDVT